MQQTLDLPNPDAWCDAEQAASILGIRRTNLYRLIQRGALGDYKIGGLRVYWRAEVLQVKHAREVVAGRARV